MRTVLLAICLVFAMSAAAALDVTTRAEPGILPLDGAVVVPSPQADPLVAFIASGATPCGRLCTGCRVPSMPPGACPP